MELLFNSLNPYQSLTVLEAKSPEALVELIRKIRVPIKIVSIVQVGTTSVAYIMGDLRANEKRTSTKQREQAHG